MEEQDIQRILDNYKKAKQRSKAKYDSIKRDPEFIKKNRERANEWYKHNKEKRRELNSKNREFNNMKSGYNYYKKNGRLEDYKIKHKDKYDKLVEIGYIKD